MIVGVCQKGGQDPNAIWDYTALSFQRGVKPTFSSRLSR